MGYPLVDRDHPPIATQITPITTAITAAKPLIICRPHRRQHEAWESQIENTKVAQGAKRLQRLSWPQ